MRENILVAAEIRRRWAHDLGCDPADDTEAILDRVGLRDVADERADTLPTGLARLCELGRALAARRPPVAARRTGLRSEPLLTNSGIEC